MRWILLPAATCVNYPLSGASQDGVLVVGIGALGRDLLVGQAILQCRRIELADDLALGHSRAFGLDRDDRRNAFDGAKGVLVLRTLERTLLDHGDLQVADPDDLREDVGIRAT